MLSTLDKDIAQTRLVALTEEMCLTLQRASRSLYVRETADFACAIADRSGRFVAYPQGIGVSGFVGLDLTATIAAVQELEPLQPGDVILTNDPYHSDGLSTHLPDVHAIAPYFHDGEIVAYGWTFIHVSDVGGRVPSSVSVQNDSIFAEGLRIPPLKYVSQGRVVAAVERILAANSRTPEVNRGDLQAMLAALDRARDRVADFSAEYGTEGLAQAGAYAREQTAIRAREALRRLRDGEYRFTDYLDNDGTSAVPLRIALTATVSDGTLTLDFTGTDPQVEAALNMVTWGRAHSWVVTRVFALVGTLDPDLPLNGGLMDVLRFTAPAGTLLNAVEPAAVGVRHATVSRVNDVVTGALAQAAPDILPAASSGLVVPVVFAERSGTGTSVQVVEPMVGGTGARQGADGIDGRDSGISNLSNNPVEQVESGIRVRVLHYGIRPDSGGAGHWRGGCGLELEFEALSDGALLARGLERLRFRPWGYAGGQAGKPAELIVNEGRQDERRLRLVDVEPLRAGDRVVLRTSGAGGYGDPLQRDIAAVVADVAAGLVSIESAERDYGVRVVAGAADEDATARLRAAARPADAAAWGWGPEREAWDRVFPDTALNELSRALEGHAPQVRSQRRRALLSDALALLPEGFPAGVVGPGAERAARDRFLIAVESLTAGG